VSLSVEQLEKELDELLAEATRTLTSVDQLPTLESIRVKFLGRRGALSGYFPYLKGEEFGPDEKKRLGQKLNTVKTHLEKALAQHQEALSHQAATPQETIDLTLPGTAPSAGRLHPISQTVTQILTIFRSLGFAAVEGPQLETEHNNFEALNIPTDHPSRESFDTFYLSDQALPKGGNQRFLLRSHTSPMQIRFMESHKPPFQIVVPGRVFRPDAVDASHCFQFHQVEGLAVGEGLTFGDLRGVLSAWARGMFGGKARLRFRPHFFPFTEPSAEADLKCIFCDGKGCRVCGQKGWLEILGCGVVHPEVFKAVGYLPSTVGFAFGMGVERIAMLLYGIEDIRLFFENDMRFLEQFR